MEHRVPLKYQSYDSFLNLLDQTDSGPICFPLYTIIGKLAMLQLRFIAPISEIIWQDTLKWVNVSFMKNSIDIRHCSLY